MIKSEPKTHSNESNVCLPFPNPMITSNGSVIWPFSQKGFPLFYGLINLNEKCVEISDETSVKCLQNMGFFGFHSKFRFNSNFEQKNEDLIESKDEIKTKITSKYSNGKYVLISTSVPNALSESSFCDNYSEKSEKSDLISEIETKESTKGEKSETVFTQIESFNETNSLKLSFLESFFMSYIFGSLNVLNTETNNYMTIDEMWDTFGLHYSEDNLEFAVHYSAYHYLRSKGWVVRNGHSFGTNFLLYKEGPQLYHAIYSVVIQCSIDGQYKQPFDWYYMSALIRLSKNVRKELIICVINVPKDCDISSPNCIKNFEIELLHFDRWNVTKGIANE